MNGTRPRIVYIASGVLILIDADCGYSLRLNGALRENTWTVWPGYLHGNASFALEQLLTGKAVLHHSFPPDVTPTPYECIWLLIHEGIVTYAEVKDFVERLKCVL